MSGSQSRSGTFVLTTLLLIATIAVSLLVAEFAVRTFYPQRLYFNVSQWDPDTGFSPIPNIEGFSRHQDYTMHIKINSRGLRDREFSLEPPPDTVRIGVFGDSFTFGEGVQNDETYPKLLEKLLNQRVRTDPGGGQIEVLNFGIGKTGTSHQLAWYRKEGKKYHLDYVLLGFLAGNDFNDNWGGVYFLRDGKLVHNPTAYSSIRKIQAVVYKIPFYRWLAANSHLVNLARKGATILDDRLRRKKGVKQNLAKNKSSISAEKYQLTLRLVDAFRSDAEKDGAQFIFVNLAAKYQRPVHAYAEGETIKPQFVKNEALLQDLRRQGVTVIDLVPVFAGLPVEEYYFETDGHLNVNGLNVVADQIDRAINDDVDRTLRKKRGSVSR